LTRLDSFSPRAYYSRLEFDSQKVTRQVACVFGLVNFFDGLIDPEKDHQVDRRMVAQAVASRNFTLEKAKERAKPKLGPLEAHIDRILECVRRRRRQVHALR
jgi:hypothetical protein